ncbi:hypothetical protein SARC_02556 [Sphaeroforma arctica JP610]|uniref:Uncharacterized protein n=1 Tax=Sphaeroforma arctica JP610 TaxID=667725 RepID=A0A0L0G8D4_9EUKA|nr:hypothetical protein SARC_02556 [Sphaeroforma arctica JP610]KNC85260.1 hypothetical protein SARC_02556 [Sphaeroforma arctica JP610]|eukprot:XP_014159162.1 hypothetical protein SARC_02556 [Sphaeroforma arctica JP610]
MISQDQDQEESDDTSRALAAPHGGNERLESRIPGSAARHGVGYQAPSPEVGPMNAAPSRVSISLQDFAHAQQRAAQDPHGPETSDNRRDRLSGTIYSQQQSQRFEADALRDSLPRHTTSATHTTPAIPPAASDKETLPTPESIAADRQVLHARML